jgi:hypothetical protein
VTDHHSLPDGQAIEEAGQGVGVEIEPGGWSSGAPIPQPVRDDRGEVVPEQGDDVVPVEGGTGLAVEEHNRRPAAVVVGAQGAPIRVEDCRWFCAEPARETALTPDAARQPGPAHG